ncbi:MAG: hypothetical protein FJZ47_05145 [Candidatus Tectomicrobia bacterium]|uniref:Lipoprotein n=1 Tax=Tectimicrobiota bacterium TaxID=2528274 RepID=A0A937W0P8_UNCTE|nr:hypothetical protein [Candidatus Tectomicrobia bacterium]
MQHMRPILRSLGAFLILMGALTLTSCTATDEQARANDVTNKAFTFTNGAVFHAALLNVPTTLEFLNRAQDFALSSPGGMALGSNRFGSCLLTVTTSTYAAGAGPQVNDVITLSRCDFDEANRTLTVTAGAITATSNPAITRVVNATPNELNNRSFLFADGTVFHPALATFATTLRFENNANTFILTSTVSGTSTTARGTNVLSGEGANAFGVCTLRISSSEYRAGNGPQIGEEIRLSPCAFNSATGALVLSNGMTTINSI